MPSSRLLAATGQRMKWCGPLILAAMAVGCGITVKDKGSDVNVSGVSLIYTDWVPPSDSNWDKDSYECDHEAREAVPGLIRIPGRRQVLAERCLMARGYVRR